MSQLQEIRKPIEQELLEFKRIFDKSVHSSNPLLNQAIHHIKKGSGKMMRPILVLLLSKLKGEIRKESLYAAVSLELLHTASLVHDDVVDESGLRRGQKSVNALFDNKLSVLVGDFLLATSLMQVSKTENFDIINVVSTLGQELAEGEILQLSNIDNREFSEDVYFDIIYKKTAALFAACAKVAALSSGATQEEVLEMTRFGELLGICFQIKDDIFDYSSSNDIGKPTGNDMLEGKLTLPALFALNTRSNAELRSLAFAVKEGSATDTDIQHFIRLIIDCGGLAYAEQTMLKYREQALAILDDLPDSSIKQSLTDYLDYIVLRKK